MHTSFPYLFLDSKQEQRVLGFLKKTQAFGKKSFKISVPETAFHEHLYKSVLGLFCMCAFIFIALARAKHLKAEVRSPCASLDPHVLPRPSKSLEKSLPDGATWLRAHALKYAKKYRFDTYLRGFWVIWGCSEGFHEITCLIFICCRYQLFHGNLLALQLSPLCWLVLSVLSCAESLWLWKKKMLLFRMIIVPEEKPFILWQTGCVSAGLVQHSGKRGWALSAPGPSVVVTYGEMRLNGTF